MLSHLRLLRPLNALMAGIGVAVGGLVAVGPTQLWTLPQLSALLLAAIAAICIIGGGNALNDVLDAPIDAVAHPQRPIPSGALSAQSAKRTAVLLFVLGNILALLLLLRTGRPLPLTLALLNSGLLWAYEHRFKAVGLGGNVTVAYLSGSVFLFGALSVLDLPAQVGTGGLQAAVVLVILALLANLAREVAKDLQDVEGDRGHRTTLPMTAGEPMARRLVQAVLVVTIAASVLPSWPLQLFSSVPYLPLVLAADATFLYAAAAVARTPERCADAAKLAMLIALVAFASGGLGFGG